MKISHYTVLGINQDASQQEIEAAYKRLSKELDPKNNNDQEFFKEEYKKVQEAYRALSNSSILATEKGARMGTKETHPINSLQKNQSNRISKFFLKKTAVIMMSLVIVTIAFISYFLLQPEVFLINDTITVKGITKTKKDLKPITGVINGMGVFKNGIKEGKHQILHDSLNILLAEGKFKKGVKKGKWQYYYDNGQLKKEVNYKNGLKDGYFQFWNNKGLLIAERNYKADSIVGTNKAWSNNGQLIQVADYDDDFIRIFNRMGEVSYEGSFLKIASEWSSITYQNTRSSLSLAPLEPNIKWRYRVKNAYETPCISGGLVFVASSDVSDGYINALDQFTGELIWRSKSGPTRGHSTTVSEGMVFVASNDVSDSYIYALDKYTGELIWRSKTEGKFRDITVSEGIVLSGGYDSYITALDQFTGEPLWAYKNVEDSRQSCVSDGIVYFGSTDGYIYALNQFTGELKWRYETQGSTFVSIPSVSEGNVYMGSNDNYIYALDQFTGQLIWRYKTTSTVFSPSVSAGLVFVASADSGDSYIYALDQFTGELIWRSQAGTHTSAYTVSGGMLFAGSLDNIIYALDQFTGELKWRYKTKAGAHNQFPAICNGMMFFVDSGEDYVYAFDN